MSLNFGEFAAGTATVTFECNSNALSHWFNHDAPMAGVSHAVIELAPVVNKTENDEPDGGVNQPEYPGSVITHTVSWGNTQTVTMTPGTWKLTVRLYDTLPTEQETSADIQINHKHLHSGMAIVEPDEAVGLNHFLDPALGITPPPVLQLPFAVMNKTSKETTYTATLVGSGVADMGAYLTLTGTPGVDYNEHAAYVEIINDL